MMDNQKLLTWLATMSYLGGPKRRGRKGMTVLLVVIFAPLLLSIIIRVTDLLGLWMLLGMIAIVARRVMSQR